MRTSIFSCSKCGNQFPKWAGRCESCGAWGTVLEEENQTTAHETEKNTSKPGKIKLFSDKFHATANTIPTNVHALDFILGGGLVSGSVSLIAGEPGIGKSTLLAQCALAVTKNGKRVMYVTGEESPTQVKRRLERLSPKLPETLFALDETNADIIAATILNQKPDLTIIDSIQTIRTEQANGEAGSVSQIKSSAAIITAAAKSSSCPVILVGQVTKEGDVAGPRILEHLVDTVLFLEGDNAHRYRLLRCLKHRFGPTDEIAVMTMTEHGLETVTDPSEELLRDRLINTSGTAITCLLEGHRCVLIELQALVTSAGYGTPIRRATGIDQARLGILLAVLAKRANIHALDKDVYVNATGGIDARDPSNDLGLALAIMSAVKEKALDPRTGCMGEIGLAGELRPISLPEVRLKEFSRLGFTTVIGPQIKKIQIPKGLTYHGVGTLREAIQYS
ncbi:DNA repair protein RadA [Candidatus Uhrbacteria bacterium]|nr:DNA repair protein RadA [Candidatus Uhrbacteria bacterium]